MSVGAATWSRSTTLELPVLPVSSTDEATVCVCSVELIALVVFVFAVDVVAVVVERLEGFELDGSGSVLLLGLSTVTAEITAPVTPITNRTGRRTTARASDERTRDPQDDDVEEEDDEDGDELVALPLFPSESLMVFWWCPRGGVFYRCRFFLPSCNKSLQQQKGVP